MARKQKIRVSSQEKFALDAVRDDIFGTDSVPYGEVIQTLVDNYYDE